MYATKIVLLLCAFSVLIDKSEGLQLWTSIKEFFTKLFSGFRRSKPAGTQTFQTLKTTSTKTDVQYKPAGTQTSQKPETTSTQIFETLKGKVHEVTSKTSFDSLMKKAYDKTININAEKQMVVLYHTYTGCGPCKPITEQIQGFAETYNEVIFIKVLWDDPFLALPEAYKITSYPTVQFIKRVQGVEKVKEQLVPGQMGRIKAEIEKYK